MNTNRPLILISNDDGFFSKGLSELIKFLRPIGELVVRAPDSARSGYSSAMTTNIPIHYQLVNREVGVTIYKCSGTPTDCIKLAMHTILDRKPDLVIGGINHGDNSAVNVHYSGTMGVVIKGALKGIPSIGYSITTHDLNVEFGACGPYIQQITRMVLEKGLPALTCLNVNFPTTPSFKGIRICEQSKGQWVNEWETITRKGGSTHYWLTRNFEDSEPNNEKSDHWALANGYVAITPVTVDVTAYSLIDELKTWFK